MKLWILTENPDLPDDKNPWYPHCNRIFTCVLRAETEEEARKMVSKIHGDETPRSYELGLGDPWLDPKLSQCKELTASGTAQVICLEES